MLGWWPPLAVWLWLNPNFIVSAVTWNVAIFSSFMNWGLYAGGWALGSVYHHEQWITIMAEIWASGWDFCSVTVCTSCGQQQWGIPFFSELFFRPCWGGVRAKYSVVATSGCVLRAMMCHIKIASLGAKGLSYVIFLL